MGDDVATKNSLSTKKSKNISSETILEDNTLSNNINKCKNCGNIKNDSFHNHYKSEMEVKGESKLNLQNNQIINRKLIEPNENDLSSIDKRFSEWIHCMCVVTFDLELGQAMEDFYPKNAVLTEQEKMNICYLAFPDSNSSCMGDTQYHVRLRLSSDNIDSLPLNSVQQKFSARCIPVQRPDLTHYWGFVYFRQKKDKTIPRGYFQKSFILLTRLPFFNLFNEIVSVIAPRYFHDGKQILKIVYDQINNWPTLQADETYTLHLLGTVYRTNIPKSNNKTHSSNKNSSYNNIMFNKDQNNSKYSTENFTESNICKYDSKISNKDTSQNENLCSNCENEVKRENNVKEFVGPMLPPQDLTSVHEIDIFRSLSPYISNIYTLWELVLVAEPIVVMGSSPVDCSHMVQSLISLIYPLCYLAESRPYFTIHDSEFKEFTSPSINFSDVSNGNLTSSGNANYSAPNKSNLIPPPIILGVTNPFFGKLLQNWPNMIKLPDSSQHIYSIIPKFSFGNSSRNLTDNETGNNYDDIGYCNISNPSTIKVKNSELLTNYGSNNSNSNLINIVTGNIDLKNIPGLYLKYKPFLKKDKSLIKKIQLGIKTKRPQQVQSVLLRRHFLELTQSFMIPLERYMASLMPLQKDISPFKAAPNPNEFKQDEFLATLEQSGPHLTSSLKGNWKGLYKRFFKSPNFNGWYETRYKELKQTLQELQLQALSDADLNQWAHGKREVEIIDMILKLKQKLTLCSDSQLITNNFLKSTTRIQILKQIDSITQSLPDDLKIIIQKSTSNVKTQKN